MVVEDWTRVGEIAVMAVVVYAVLVALLRLTGKRTTSKMNSFDWVVTVALGSMVATVILVDEVPLVEGVVGIASLVALQYGVAWTAARWPGFQKLIKASPRLLYYRDGFDEEALRQERLSREEVAAAIRAQGFCSMDEISAVVLETNADLSILPESDGPIDDVLYTVKGWESDRSDPQPVRDADYEG